MEVMGSSDVIFAIDPAVFPLRYYLEVSGIDSTKKMASTYRFRTVLDDAGGVYIVQCFLEDTLVDTMTQAPASWTPLSWDRFE